MRMAPDLHFEWVEDEAVVLNPATKQLHYLNPSAALVCALIEEIGYHEAIAKLRDNYKGTAALEQELDDLMTDLRERGLLVDD